MEYKKNMKKKLVNIVCKFGDRYKPIILKILPKSLLKKIKSKIIQIGYIDNMAKIPCNKTEYPFGINLIGYIKAGMGLGQGCRLIACALEKAKIPFCIMDTRVGNPFNHSNTSWDNHIVKEPIYRINIFHVNPEQMLPLLLSLPTGALDMRYNIGIWLWELEKFPNEWKFAFEFVDEVWAPSKFTVKSIQSVAPCEVRLVPYGITAEINESIDREYFSLPKNKFLFLTMYDVNSTIQRKNPIGSIKAFKLAFSPLDNEVGLVVKINNATNDDLILINRELGGYKNIYIIDRNMEKLEVNTLIKCVDSVVSLHRSEGFGLVIAEAMLLGTVVIATNYSANTDFMNSQNSCPVDYKMVDLTENYFSYKTGQQWAEPNYNHAAKYMKKLSLDRDYYNNISSAGMAYIRNNLSIENCAAIVKASLERFF